MDLQQENVQQVVEDQGLHLVITLEEEHQLELVELEQVIQEEQVQVELTEIKNSKQ